MARVIQQRKSGPPYLLILFVFLFLVSTVLAVLFYLNGDKATTNDRKSTENYRAVAGSATDNPKYQDMLAEARRPGGTPVLVQMEQQFDRATRLLTGNATSLSVAEAEANKAFARIGLQPGLAQGVLDAYDEIDKQKALVKARDAEIASLKKDLETKDKELKDLAKASADKQAELNKTIDARVKELADVRAEREKAVSQLTEDRDKEIKGRDKTIAEQNDRLIRLDGEIVRLKKEIAVREGSGGIDTVKNPVQRQPQRKVLQASGADTAYIDLGAGSRVRPGMTFAVYPSTGITRDPNDWKAKILVTSVGETFSTCRVTALADKRNSVTSGDVLFNPVFDATRTYKFVVVGLFDLYGTRRADLQGAEEVKALIQRFGGVVQNEVTPDTDYLVVGEMPSAPKAPEGGGVAPPMLPEVEKARQQYVDAMKKIGEYRGVQTLNTNRFLQLTGFDPSAVTGGK